MTRSPLTVRLPLSLRLAGGALLAAVVLAACGGGGTRQARGRCPAPRPDSLVAQAVLAYLGEIRRSAPYPQRFLVAAGTDSALPDPALSALQRKGPTYLYPKDTAQQAKLLARLQEVGSYNTLLVALRGVETADPSRTVVRLSGAYVGGQHDGTATSPYALIFECDSTERWSLTRTDQERSS